MSGRDPLQLYWRADALASILKRHNITSAGNPRQALAQRIGIPLTTVVSNLSKDWEGRVQSLPVLAAICRTFHVKLATIVHEPSEQP